MKLFELFRRTRDPSANQARERLQILLAHERRNPNGPDFLGQMQKDLLAVIAKYVDVDQEKVSVQLNELDGTSMLEVNIEMPPEGVEPKAQRRQAR
jgi:cell division topological specificity factor